MKWIYLGEYGLWGLRLGGDVRTLHVSHLAKRKRKWLFCVKNGEWSDFATDASDYIFASSWLEKRKTVGLSGLVNASVNSTCAQHPPVLLRGICLPCQSRGWGNCKFCTARRPGICQPPGHSRTFDTHAVSYQNITTQKVLLEKKQIGSSVKDRNKL